MSGRVDRPRSYIPSPEEIAAMCERIRREWTPREERSRRVGNKLVRWQVPTIRVVNDSAEHVVGLEPSETLILPPDSLFDAT